MIRHNKARVAMALAFFVATIGFAEAQSAPAASSAMVEGKRYIVYSDLGLSRAEGLVARFDALFELFNAEFRFDAQNMESKLVVRELMDRRLFDEHISRAVGAPKEDFVYLHYSTPARRELVLFAKDEPEYSASLAHQAFVQFIKAFVKNPPLWMRDGYAIYFESARWNEATGLLEFPENLAWLETTKALLANGALIPIERLLSLGADESRSLLDVFYPESWALVSFLSKSADRGWNRLLWDSISALEADASLEENQNAVGALFKSWYGKAEADKAFIAYLDNRKIFSELAKSAAEAYESGSYAEAKGLFEKARGLNPQSYLPPYYLGLIAYAAGDFAQAELHYRNALALGCDAGAGNYALALNALALDKKTEAAAFLEAAKSASPERYGAKVDELQPRLQP